VPSSSYGRGMLRKDGGLNKIFLTYLFCDQAIAIQFLKDVDLLRGKVQCNSCGRYITWSAQRNIPERLEWRCRRKVAGARCSKSRSMNHGSKVLQSKYICNVIIEGNHRVTEGKSYFENTKFNIFPLSCA